MNVEDIMTREVVTVPPVRFVETGREAAR